MSTNPAISDCSVFINLGPFDASNFHGLTERRNRRVRHR